MSKTFYFSWIAIMILMGCGSLSPAVVSQPDILSGQWEMIKWQESDHLDTSFPRGVPILNMDTNEGIVDGFNGCNQLTGQFRFNREETSLQFFGLSATKMFCLSVAESDFSRIISLVNGYRVTEDHLYLLRNGNELMVFSRTIDR